MLYEDITEKMMKNISLVPNEYREVFEYYKKNPDETITIFNTDNTKFDPRGPNAYEKATIGRLKEIFGFDIDFVHRVNQNNISTPDIRNRIEKLEYWDIKNFEESKSENAKNSKILNAIRKKKNQTVNFVVDLNSPKCDLDNKSALHQN